MANLVQFGSYSLDAAKEEREQLEREGGADFMKLGVGRNVVRVLPPLRGKNSPFRVTYQHYVPTADGVWSFTCPRLEAKQNCPLCNFANRLRKSGKPKDRDEAYALLPKRRVFCNVINRAEPEKGPVVLAFGKSIHEELVKLREDEDAGGDFTHPVNGIDVIIDREGSGKNDTRYTVNLARRSCPIHPEAAQVAEWAELMEDLDRFATLPSDEELQTKMDELFGEGGDSAPAPAPAQRQRSASNASRPRRQQQAARPRTAQDDIQDAEYSDAGDGDGNEDWGMPQDGG